MSLEPLTEETTSNTACAAGSMGRARNKFPMGVQYRHPPRGFAARLAAPPPKLYFACAYNTASYAGYFQYRQDNSNSAN